MKLGTFSTADSGRRAGIFTDDDGVIDIEKASGGALPSSLLDIINRKNWRSELNDLADHSPHHRQDAITIHTPIERPGKILAAAGNYQAHIDEGGGTKVDTTRRTPRVFIKPSSALIGPDEPVVVSEVTPETDWELELAVVIGDTARNVGTDDALAYVAGYTILNDVSARSMSWGIDDREVHDWDGFFDWLVGKWLDSFSPAGPWIVTSDEIGDPHDLQLTLELNGELTQDASTGTMIFGCAELISFISRFTTLEPGDMIATGTPAGVGVATGRFLKPGDEMVGKIERIGTLRNPVVDA